MNCSHSEAFGRVTAEYMLAGLLTVASDTGANVELIDNRKTGILFKKSDDIDLLSKLRWIRNNRLQCKAIAESGRKCARKDYSIESNIDRFYEYYKTLTKK